MKQFNAIRINKPGRNAFDLSHERKFSMNMGKLYPIMVQEVVPGDKFRVSTESVIRLAPMLAPVMHRVNSYIHYFFVPNRLVYSDWETFITGGESGNLTPAFPAIRITDANKAEFAKGSLADHMGVPVIPSGTTVTQTLDINALPFRAYHLIYNEYYRDQNLQTAVPISKSGTVSASEETELLYMRTRAWEKDYFTSALPWAQRGGDVMLPTTIQYKDFAEIYGQGPGKTPIATGGAVSTNAGNPGSLNDGDETLKIENIDGLDVTINDLRRSNALQVWLERNARGGARYIEQILSHFGVKSSDARLQRPEFLGGGKTPIVISEVLATFNNTETPGGTMYGHGISVGNMNRFKKSFEEHGFILAIMSVLPRTCYQQGLPRFYSKFDKFDYYFPEFAHLGEQEVKNQELYYDPSGTSPKEGTFGYQSRYAEYKFKESTVHGDFKENLSYWHMGRIFESAPSLNLSFVSADPTHRIFPVDDPAEDKLYVQLYNNVQAIRPLPVFSEPML